MPKCSLKSWRPWRICERRGLVQNVIGFRMDMQMLWRHPSFCMSEIAHLREGLSHNRPQIIFKGQVERRRVYA